MQRPQKAQPGIQGQGGLGGGEGRGDSGLTGRPLRGPSQPDSGMEEGTRRGSPGHFQQRSRAEGQERRWPHRPPVPGDRRVEDGTGFLGGEFRSMSLTCRRQLVDRQHSSLSIVRQCAPLGVSRSGLYYRPKGVSREDLALMQAMDRQYLEAPFYGWRRMKAWLVRQGCQVSRKRVQRMMRIMGLRAIYRLPRTSRPAPVIGSIPTCWKMSKWLSPTRYGRRTSPICPWPGGSSTWWPGGCPTPWRRTAASRRCRTRWAGADPRYSTPTVAACPPAGSSPKCSGTFRDHEVRISMDGKGRYADNIFVERLWRTV